MTFGERFGCNLAKARERAGMTQEDLGFYADLHRTAVGQLERGHRTARLDTFVKLVNSLHVEPAELLEGLTWTRSEIIDGRWSSFEG
jgi:transcriptional regulator with XRE-family HTH domain